MPTKGENQLTIAEARNYFENNISKLSSNKGKSTSTSSSETITLESILANKQPIWDKAYEQLISTGGAVKIPLDLGLTYAVVNKKNGAVVPFSSLNYLLMYKDSLQNVRAEWVMLAPDSAWLYGNRNSYTGRIIVRNWQGKKIKDLSYHGGTITHNSISVKSSSGSKIAAISGSTINSEAAGPFCVTFLDKDKCSCPWAKINGVWHPELCDRCWQCTVNFCAWPPECANCDDPPLPPGGGGGSGGSGGTGGGGNLGGGGGAGGEDYPPNCNSDPNYVMPTTPPPPGTEWMMPCGSVPIPVVPGTDPNAPTPVSLTPAEFLINVLEITDQDQQDFISNPLSGVAEAFVKYLHNENNSQFSRDYAKWLVSYLYSNPSADYHDFLDKNEFSGISDQSSAANANPIGIINNGVTSGEVPANAPIGPPVKVGSTTRRHPPTAQNPIPEDLQYGTNGNTSGIYPFMVSKSTDELLTSMNVLLTELTFLSMDLTTAKKGMFEKFKNSEGGTFSSAYLNMQVDQSPEFENFIRIFGRRLGNELTKTGGNITTISNIDMSLDHIAFTGTYNRYHGLQILINDTEYTEINMLNYQTTSPNTFVIDVDVEIYDHFGLDKHDALTYQGSHGGFAAWWLLQHTRNFKPFETKIKIRRRIYGYY